MTSKKNQKKTNSNLLHYFLIAVISFGVIIEIISSKQQGKEISMFNVGIGVLLVGGFIFDIVRKRN